MGADTNDLDTREEDKARTEGWLAEFWEDEQEELNNNQGKQDEQEDKSNG